MDSIQPSVYDSVDQLHHLETVLEKHLSALKAKKISMIALHLSDIAGEIPNFEKCYTALVQSEEIFAEKSGECAARMILTGVNVSCRYMN